MRWETICSVFFLTCSGSLGLRVFAHIMFDDSADDWEGLFDWRTCEGSGDTRRKVKKQLGMTGIDDGA